MKRLLLLLAFLSFLYSPSTAQLSDEALLAGFHWRNIGPANQGGRIVDIEAVEKDFRRVFLATASGGVWRSDNAGTSWTPIFGRYETACIGDIALFQPNPDIIWVGTGEPNNRNSVSWGNGVYKSSDGGQTFRHLGLANTHQIARVLAHPRDSNIAYVAAIGHLWGYSGERGLFQTTDGGKSWKNLANSSQDEEVHGDFHALWIDPNQPDRYYLGADKGASITHDHGQHFILFDNLPIGQFYRIGADWRDPYYVYGGMQDNGTYGVASFSRDARGILNDSNWKLHWGDGQFIQPDPTDWRTLFTEMENGSSFRYNVKTYEMHRIQPNDAVDTVDAMDVLCEYL